jgi:hypothetical protein
MVRLDGAKEPLTSAVPGSPSCMPRAPRSPPAASHCRWTRACRPRSDGPSASSAQPQTRWPHATHHSRCHHLLTQHLLTQNTLSCHAHLFCHPLLVPFVVTLRRVSNHRPPPLARRSAGFQAHTRAAQPPRNFMDCSVAKKARASTGRQPAFTGSRHRQQSQAAVTGSRHRQPRTSPASEAPLMNSASRSGLEGMVKGTFMRERTEGSTGEV